MKNTIFPHKFWRPFLDCMPQLFLRPKYVWFPVHLKGPMIPNPSGQLAELIVKITSTRVDLYSHQILLKNVALQTCPACHLEQCMKRPVAHSLNSTWFWIELPENCCEPLKFIMKYISIQFCERPGHGRPFHALLEEMWQSTPPPHPTTRGDEKHLSFEIWCVLYWRLYGRLFTQMAL